MRVGFLGPKVFEALEGNLFPAGVQPAETRRRGVIDAVVATRTSRAARPALALLVDPAAAPRCPARRGHSSHRSAWESS